MFSSLQFSGSDASTAPPNQRVPRTTFNGLGEIEQRSTHHVVIPTLPRGGRDTSLAVADLDCSMIVGSHIRFGSALAPVSVEWET